MGIAGIFWPRFRFAGDVAPCRPLFLVLYSRVPLAGEVSMKRIFIRVGYRNCKFLTSPLLDAKTLTCLGQVRAALGVASETGRRPKEWAGAAATASEASDCFTYSRWRKEGGGHARLRADAVLISLAGGAGVFSVRYRRQTGYGATKKRLIPAFCPTLRTPSIVGTLRARLGPGFVIALLSTRDPSRVSFGNQQGPDFSASASQSTRKVR